MIRKSLQGRSGGKCACRVVADVEAAWEQTLRQSGGRCESRVGVDVKADSPHLASPPGQCTNARHLLQSCILHSTLTRALKLPSPISWDRVNWCLVWPLHYCTSTIESIALIKNSVF
ncbi:hypothetical protein PoB_005960800 [Plakobranchus ocellatus]|uniref:Uncharacterized protein n=1 Tax=Plakobranchus ocellatus TaxID=259542 RepID=A0AAV4CN93_9GAST|nr:hypothetical protein PoB_005960800 [Plakobranchus ocellatus]